jgi:hypothetical protein
VHRRRLTEQHEVYIIIIIIIIIIIKYDNDITYLSCCSENNVNLNDLDWPIRACEVRDTESVGAKLVNFFEFVDNEAFSHY